MANTPRFAGDTSSANPNTNSSIRSRLPGIAGGVLLLLSIVIGIVVSRNRGEDFAYLYVLGRMLAQGENPYAFAELRPAFQNWIGFVPNSAPEIFYPPSTGILVLPFTLFRFEIARQLWLLFLMGITIFSLRALLEETASHWSAGARLFALGLIMCASSLRWCFQLMQAGPLALSLLALFVVALLRHRYRAALACAGCALCLKITFGLPFIGLLALRRKFGLALGALGIWAVVNGAGFAIAGGGQAIQGYRVVTSRLETTANQVNSPNPYLGQSLPRLDWPYLINAITVNEPFARVLGVILTLLSIAVLIVAGKRCKENYQSRETLLLFLMPLSCLTLLSVYHHHYDAVLLVAPLLVYISLYRAPFAFTPPLWCWLPALLYVTIYAQQQTYLLWIALFGNNSYIGLKLLGGVVTALLFAGSLWSLRRTSATAIAISTVNPTEPVEVVKG